MKKIWLLLLLWLPCSRLNGWPLTVYDGSKVVFTYDVTAETHPSNIKSAIEDKFYFNPHIVLHMRLLSLTRGIYVDFEYDVNRAGINILTALDLNAQDSKDIFFVGWHSNGKYQVLRFENSNKSVKDYKKQTSGERVLKIYDGSMPRKLLLTYKYNGIKDNITASFNKFKEELREIVKSEFKLFLFSELWEKMGVEMSEGGFRNTLDNDSEDIYVMLPPSKDSAYPIYNLYKMPAPASAGPAAAPVIAPVIISQDVYNQWLELVRRAGSSLEVKISSFILLEGAYEYNKIVAPEKAVIPGATYTMRHTLDEEWKKLEFEIRMQAFVSADFGN